MILDPRILLFCDLTYLTNLAYLVIIAKDVKIVKEVICCDVSPVAMFGSYSPPSISKRLQHINDLANFCDVILQELLVEV